MLAVYLEDRPVGRIEEARPGLSFAYAPEWLAGEGAFAISLTMPLRAEPYASEIATPWLANLLPEDRQLERVGQLLGRSAGDVYGLLEEMGRDIAGALSIGGPEPVAHGRYRALDERQLADIIARLPERPLLAGEAGVTMSLAGAQSKLAVAVLDGGIHLPLEGSASTHILKPASDRLHDTVENELLCLRLAAKAGLPAAPAVMGLAGGKRYLLVERYDRRIAAPNHGPGRQVERRHQEDFCQALGIYPTQKYEASRGPRLADLFSTIDRHAARPAGDRLALLDLVIFACCIGDTDRHGKNYALLLGPGGVRLAPGYDLMSALDYEGITRNLAMTIAGKNRAEYLERRHWERFARSVGLAPAATVRRVEQLASVVAKEVGPLAIALSDSFPLDRGTMAQFSAKIAERARIVGANSRRGPKAGDEEPEEEETG